MTIVQYRGFAGTRLEADVIGSDHDPAVLLLHDIGQTRAVWANVAEALEQAGRRVISLDMRGHGGSEPADGARQDFDAMAEDLRAVLAQLGTRPVVVAATLGARIAVRALARDAALLASGLVLVDMPIGADDITAKGGEASGLADPDRDGGDRPLAGLTENIALPSLYLRGVLADSAPRSVAAALVGQFPDGELVDVEEGVLAAAEDRLDALGGYLVDFLERRAPRAWPEYRAGSDARTFRDALGCFATGVTVVTAIGPDDTPVGLTANSFTSVSLDPPLLLVCIANRAGSAAALRAADRFAVNVLQIGQQPTSNRFAGKGEDRFATTPWEVGEFGTPVLAGSLSSFECAREAVHDGGDHFILVGRVLKAIFEPRRDPLLYFRGKYRKLHFA